jgi:hypothetical protein
MKELRSEIEIDAPPEAVWHELTDFAAFPDWNPFIKEASGALEVGRRLRVRIQPPGTRGMSFKPRLLRVDENRELRWLGRLVVPGLFDGEHIFEIHAVGSGQTRFVQREIFRGALVRFAAPSLDDDTRKGFEEMNRALKNRVEKKSAPAD